MFLRPKRTRAGLAFLGGLSISLALLAGAYWLFQSQQQALLTQLTTQAALDAQHAFEQAHPMDPVYVFSRDMRAGDVLQEQDLLLREMPVALIPADSVREPAAACGLVVRGAVKANTLCADSLLYGQQDYPDDARLQEFTSIRLPSRLEENQCVDVRVTFPNGLDYVVLAKKSVQSLEQTEAGPAQRVWLTVNEEEILRVSSAIVDAYLHPGTVLYALTYVAPDVQQAAICTYPANTYVQDLILQNPNILTHAITALDRANREWFDAIPDPQPNQPLAIVPAPEGALTGSAGDVIVANGADGVVSAGVPARPAALPDSQAATSNAQAALPSAAPPALQPGTQPNPESGAQPSPQPGVPQRPQTGDSSGLQPGTQPNLQEGL